MNGDIAGSVADHYRNHLAPIYLWMAGGFDAALSRGEAEIGALFPDLPGGAVAVDLGAGFGMHALPLARRGCTVVAVDTSALLLGELERRAEALPVRTVEDDLSSFQRHLGAPADLIICMGDTLSHLAEPQAVEGLFSRVAESLRPGGSFAATFRDYTQPLAGPARFVPVRSDADRILTCFLEYGPHFVDVHDVLHERNGAEWQLRVSAYRKLRLSPGWVVAALQARGFSVRAEPGIGGMVRVVAAKA